jgi:hypothetical protein
MLNGAARKLIESGALARWQRSLLQTALDEP